MEETRTMRERYDAALSTLSSPTLLGEADVDGLGSAFVSRWVKIHREGLAPFSTRERSAAQAPSPERALEHERALNARVGALLRKRKAVVSLIAQALTREAAGPAGDLRVSLRRWMEEHDALFSRVVEEELGRLRGELTRAFEARRALGAYAQTLQFRGE